MRQPQRNNNNNRSRNRGGRKPSNPMSRSFESNGPDVKIRGNASTIAEKYTTLGRDAHSAGDRVMAENYLQHAEHYNRLVAAATAQQEEKRAAEQQQREARAAEMAEAEGEQPDVENVEAGEEETENGDRNRTNGRGRNQRARRPRTPRNGKSGDQVAAKDEDGASESKPEIEGISEDAAALPEGLLGVSEKVETASVVED